MKSKTQKLLCGIGLNDSDYLVRPRVGKKCPFYLVWSNMINRCYAKSYSNRFKAYVGCSVDPRWYSFMNFKAWMGTQDWEGKHLDKDLLIEGNKVYGPDTCVFVTRELNTFLTDKSSSGGEHLLGVYKNKSGSYVAQVGSGRLHVYLGSFKTEDEAHAAYRQGKYDKALTYASRESDKRISEAILRRYRPPISNLSLHN